MRLIDTTLRRVYALCGALAAVAIIAIGVLVLINIVARLFGVYVGGMTRALVMQWRLQAVLGLRTHSIAVATFAWTSYFLVSRRAPGAGPTYSLSL